MTTNFSNSLALAAGGIVIMDPDTSAFLSVIALYENPDWLSLSLEIQSRKRGKSVGFLYLFCPMIQTTPRDRTRRAKGHDVWARSGASARAPRLRDAHKLGAFLPNTCTEAEPRGLLAGPSGGRPFGTRIDGSIGKELTP